MKKIRVITIALAGVFVAAFAMAAAVEEQGKEQDAKVELHNQTHCLVMGGKIDSTVYTDIQGQRVYYCCAGCSEKLVAEPDTYFKKAAASGVLFENVQTTCPVSGEELKDASVFTDFEGRRIVFCCDNCITRFEKTPQAFLTAMDNPDEAEEGLIKCDHPEGEDHEGHKH